MFTGALAVGLTVFDGVKVQVAPAMPELQVMATLWLNDPAAVASKLTGEEVVPRGTVTLAGDGAVNPKLTMCSVTGT